MFAPGGWIFGTESSIYWKDEALGYRLVQLDEPIPDLFEDLSCRVPMFAVTSRHVRSKKKTENNIQTQRNGVPKQSNAGGEEFLVTDTDSDSDSDSDAASTQQDAKSDPRPESPDSLFLGSEKVYSNEDDASDMEASAYLGSDYDSDLPASCINSARETCSETSTAPRQDEMVFMDEELQIFSEDPEAEKERPEWDIRDDFDSDDESYNSTPSGKIPNAGTWSPRIQAQEDQLASTRSLSGESESTNISCHGQAVLDQLVEPNYRPNPLGETSDIRVFRIHPETNKAVRIFRYSEPSLGKLLDSPPAFHPTQDALVWPVGGGQLIFANLAEKTYQMLRFSTEVPGSSIISMQTRFSACGEFLHLAGFYGATDVVEKTKWPLSLQVSTYRLSARKMTRCAPRLVNYTACELDSFRHEKPPMALRTLPFTVTWTDKHVFVTASRRELDVRRLSLFQNTETHGTKGSTHRAVFQNTQTIYLPASADMRKIYFYPRHETASQPRAGPSHRKETKEPIVATVVLSGADINLIPSSVEDKGEFIADRPPIALYLTESQLGMEPEERVKVGKPSKLQALGYNIDVRHR